MRYFGQSLRPTNTGSLYEAVLPAPVRRVASRGRKPLFGSSLHQGLSAENGRGWDRTSDLSRVKR
jgi:hypothetical protein